jgi:hypothetical protein
VSVVAEQEECEALCIATATCNAYEYEEQKWKTTVLSRVCKLLVEPQDFGTNGTQCDQKNCYSIDRNRCAPETASTFEELVTVGESFTPSATSSIELSELDCGTLGWKFEGEHTEVCAKSGVTTFKCNEEVVMYSNARNICRAAGARLCTAEEIQDNVASGTGCGLDKDSVWTQSTCNTGSIAVVIGKQTNKEPQCRAPDDGFTAGIRCCADVGVGARLDSPRLAYLIGGLNDDADDEVSSLNAIERSSVVIGVAGGVLAAVAAIILVAVAIVQQRRKHPASNQMHVNHQPNQRRNAHYGGRLIQKTSSAGTYEWDDTQQYGVIQAPLHPLPTVTLSDDGLGTSSDVDTGIYTMGAEGYGAASMMRRKTAHRLSALVSQLQVAVSRPVSILSRSEQELQVQQQAHQQHQQQAEYVPQYEFIGDSPPDTPLSDRASKADLEVFQKVVLLEMLSKPNSQPPNKLMKPSSSINKGKQEAVAVSRDADADEFERLCQAGGGLAALGFGDSTDDFDRASAEPPIIETPKRINSIRVGSLGTPRDSDGNESSIRTML